MSRYEVGRGFGFGRGRGVGEGRGVAVALAVAVAVAVGVGVAVAVGVTIGVGVGVGPDCAQYVPPVFKLTKSPQTIISPPVHTAGVKVSSRRRVIGASGRPTIRAWIVSSPGVQQVA